jgi:hypothetical protein
VLWLVYSLIIRYVPGLNLGQQTFHPDTHPVQFQTHFRIRTCVAVPENHATKAYMDVHVKLPAFTKEVGDRFALRPTYSRQPRYPMDRQSCHIQRLQSARQETNFWPPPRSEPRPPISSQSSYWGSMASRARYGSCYTKLLFDTESEGSSSSSYDSAI